MNANDYRPGEYGTLTPNPEGEKEEKKKKSKRTVIVLAGLAALLAAGGCCVGSGLVQKIIPQREEETVVVVEPADDVYVAPTPTEYIVPLSPTPTEAVQEPRDVREGWYGTYEGTAEGRRFDFESGTTSEITDDDGPLWLEIMNEDDCFGSGYCSGDMSWGLDVGFTGYNGKDGGSGGYYVNIRLFLPDDLSDAPGLTITDDTITITPTEEHPYEVVLERSGGHVEGHLETGGIPAPMEGLEQWTVDYLTAERSDAPDPAQR